MKESIELNPDGTFPYKSVKWGMEESSTFTVTSGTDLPDGFIPDPPRKKTWKDYGKELLGLYLTIAVGIGTATILVTIIKSIAWIIRYF